jgi:hypothetical protein
MTQIYNFGASGQIRTIGLAHKRSVRPVFIAFRPPLKCRLRIGRAQDDVSAIKLVAHRRLTVQPACPAAGLGRPGNRTIVAEGDLRRVRPIRRHLNAHLAGLGG